MQQIDTTVFSSLASKFDKYVHTQDKNADLLNFIDGNSLLVKEEGYKSRIPANARSILNSDEWDESWCGNGEISTRINKAMDLAGNLINFNSKIDFRRHFEDDRKEYNPDSERAIYEIFKGSDDQAAFEHAMTVFGAKYPILSYLFFIKDENRYLPASPEKIDNAFKELNIDMKLSYNCGWQNYCQYLELVREIGKLMPKYIDISHEVRLLDAHSFVWIVGEKRFRDWTEDTKDINTPLLPKKTIRDENGLIRYQCPKCEYLLKISERCPECGQLIIQQN